MVTKLIIIKIIKHKLMSKLSTMLSLSATGHDNKRNFPTQSALKIALIQCYLKKKKNPVPKQINSFDKPPSSQPLPPPFLNICLRLKLRLESILSSLIGPL